MERRKRSRPEDDRERSAPDAPPAPEHPLLELQRGAGNRAVSSLLARAPDTKEKPKEAPATGTRATLPDIGTIPLLSVQFGGSRQPGRGRGEEGEKENTSGEIVLSSRAGKHTPQLFKASLDGKPMTVEVFIAGSGATIRLELKGAIISSYTTGGGGGEEIETWTLNFQSMEQSQKSESRDEPDNSADH